MSDLKNPATKNSLFELGAAYYPDYLNRNFQNERLLTDFKRMSEQGIHTLRMGEFSWSTVEPSRGNFRPEIFIRALDLAYEQNLRVIFSTPTATPPKWLIDEHPSILPITRNGTKIPFGSRRHYDYHNAIYQEESKRITSYYAKTFGQHPSVTGWQTDNEFGCHNSVFLFTEAALTNFQNWLIEKFSGQIDNLNDAWFTAFWSQGYTSFRQIELPFSAWADQNPHLELDFRRFSNSALCQFQKSQVDILRHENPGKFITHNFMTLFSDLCPWQMSADLDIAGFDHYQMEAEPHPVSSHWQFCLMRSLRPEKFYVLEQQPVQVNWQLNNRRYAYSWLFCWGVQSAFLGARGMLYFSWQRMVGGAEQYHDGIVPHDVRVPKSQQEKIIDAKNGFFNSFQRSFGILTLPEPTKDVLCIYNSESLWSHEITSQSLHYSTRKQIDFIAQFSSSCGLSLCFAPTLEAAAQSLSEIQLLVLPGYAFEFTDYEKEILLHFVNRGGKVLSFPRTAMKKTNNQMSPLPLNIFDKNDFYFEDYGPLLPTESESFSISSDTHFKAGMWAEKIVVQNKDWQAKAVFNGGLYTGAPAILCNENFSCGGSYLHFAMCPETDADFFAWMAVTLKLETLTVPQNNSMLQVYRAAAGARTFLYAVNFDVQNHTLILQKEWRVSQSLNAWINSVLILEMDAHITQKPTKPAIILVPGSGCVVLELCPSFKL